MFAEIVRSRFVIAEQQRVAEEARQAAMTIALTDDLTGLPNRRCFQSLLADRIRTRNGDRRAVRAGTDRPRRLQAHQRRSRASGRRRDSEASRRPARQGDGRTRLGREDRRRRIRCPLQRHRRARRGDRARAGNPGDIRDALRRSAAPHSSDLRLWLCPLSLVRRRAGRTRASGRRRALPRQGQRTWRARPCSTREPDAQPPAQSGVEHAFRRRGRADRPPKSTARLTSARRGRPLRRSFKQPNRRRHPARGRALPPAMRLIRPRAARSRLSDRGWPAAGQGVRSPRATSRSSSTTDVSTAKGGAACRAASIM